MSDQMIIRIQCDKGKVKQTLLAIASYIDDENDCEGEYEDYGFEATIEEY